MIKCRVSKSNVKRTALFAYAAGATRIFANLFLIAFLPCRPATRRMGLPSARPTTWWDHWRVHS